MHRKILPPAVSGLVACSLGGLAVSAAYAADDVEVNYRKERERCATLETGARDNCLREAAAARQAARAGQLGIAGADHAQNRLLRCDALPAADRDACVRRARGEGTVSGRVEGGGIIREYREIILPPAAPVESSPPSSRPIAPAHAPAATLPATPSAVPASPPGPVIAPAGTMLEVR